MSPVSLKPELEKERFENAAPALMPNLTGLVCAEAVRPKPAKIVNESNNFFTFF